jgi:hypothetical protein
MKEWKPLLFLLLGLFIPVAGYSLMHSMFYVLPMSEDSTGMHLFLTLFIIALGLCVPYWMLMAMAHKAHLSDPREREMHLKDIPKDEQELADGR